MLASLHAKADPIKAITGDIDELVARVTRSLAATGLKLQVGNADVPPKETNTRLRHIFEDSGKALVDHAVGLDFLAAQKTSAQ